MVELFEVCLCRGKGTKLSFGIKGIAYRSYYIKKYHIFDPILSKVIIGDIHKISEKNNQIIPLLELGSSGNAVNFISEIPNCNLILKRKPKLDTEDICYVPSGEEVETKNFRDSKKRLSYCIEKMLVCEIYLPITLFKRIDKLEDHIEYYSSSKLVENRHNIYYKNYIFTMNSNYQEINLKANSEFLEDLKKIRPLQEYDSIINSEYKTDILKKMKEFIGKYQHIEMET